MPAIVKHKAKANSFIAGAENKKAEVDCLLAPLFMRDAYIGVTEHEHTGVKIPRIVPDKIPIKSFLFKALVIKLKYFIFLMK
jgi:hypothetical protein